MLISEIKAQFGITGKFDLKDAGVKDNTQWLRVFFNNTRQAILFTQEVVDKIKEDDSVSLVLHKIGEKTSQTGRKYTLYIVFQDTEKTLERV